MSPACLDATSADVSQGRWKEDSLFLVPSDNGVHEQNGDNDAEVDPVSKTGRKQDGELHNIEDRSAEIRDELEKLVLVWRLELVPSSELAFGSRPRTKRCPTACPCRATQTGSVLSVPAPLSPIVDKGSPSWTCSLLWSSSRERTTCECSAPLPPRHRRRLPS